MNPIKNCDFPASHVSLLEGITYNHQEFQVPKMVWVSWTLCSAILGVGKLPYP